MQKSVYVIIVLLILFVPSITANTPAVGRSVGIRIDTEDFAPLIWMDPDSRVVHHNPADGSSELVERINNYAFEGEQIYWTVLEMDKNGIEKIRDVYGSIG